MKPDHKTVLDTLQQHIVAQQGLPVVVGTLPPAGGVSLVAAAGTAEHYLSGGILLRMQISVNAKSRVQTEVLDMLSKAVEAAQECRTAPITGCSLRRTPAQLGMDASGCFLFGCSLEVRAFFP